MKKFSKKELSCLLDDDLKRRIPNMWGAFIETIHQQGGIEEYLFSVPQENDTAHMGFKIVDNNREYGIAVKFYKKKL